MTLKSNQLGSHTPINPSKVWLTTFNDLITILLVFFVLIYSLSRVDQGKIRNFQNALQSGLGVLLEGKPLENIPAGSTQPENAIEFGPTRTTGDQLGSAGGQPINKVPMQDLMRDVNALQIEQQQEARGEPQGIRIALENSVLFQLGSAAVSPAGRPVLDRVATAILDLDAKVRVEGHTDDIPIHTLRFSSNWELSISRAVAVVRYLTENANIDTRQVSAVGYGDSQPVVANTDEASRAKNRRVEIVLEINEEVTGNVQ